jgi:glyoxylase-like metal-dependent hydrolase (beta-lactamase superfamily II)
VATELLSLPATTTLYPGHGPATTVAEERHSNPFFDESTEAGRFRDDTATTG